MGFVEVFTHYNYTRRFHAQARFGMLDEDDYRFQDSVSVNRAEKMMDEATYTSRTWRLVRLCYHDLVNQHLDESEWTTREGNKNSMIYLIKLAEYERMEKAEWISYH